MNGDQGAAAERPASDTATDTYARLIALLDRHGARYRVVDHAPEGRTDLVSAMRGQSLAVAAKCIVLILKLGKRVTRYALAVVPGDARIDLSAVRQLFGASYVAFASPDVAERLAGSVTGTVLPFSFHPDLELLADPSLLQSAELYFNAARLDRSLALRTDDYVAIAAPRLVSMIAPARDA